MDAVETLDTFVRGGAISLLLVCAVIFLKNGLRRRKNTSLILLCTALCPYLIVSSLGFGPTEGVVRVIFIAIAALIPALVYWVALELFQDEPEVRHWQIALAGSIVLMSWLSQVDDRFGAVRGFLVLVLYLHLLVVIAAGSGGDLVEARRRFRRWFLLCLVLLGVVITGVEVTRADQNLPLWVVPVHAAAFLFAAATFLVWSVSIEPDIWVAPTRARPSDRVRKPAQTALIARIDHAMHEGLWRKEGLTISEMAHQLNTQEHRLRSAINQGLGFRNFASFINHFRIQEAKQMLSSPEQAERTVLSIAYEVGFSSLGPFNRAFRADTGMTPTAFRNDTPDAPTQYHS